MRKQFTEMELALMEGGHSITNYSFLQELDEAKMFRTRDQITNKGARGLSDHLFVSLLSLYAMSNDYSYAPIASTYAAKTMQLGNFNRPSPSSTDLYQTIFSLQRPGEFFADTKDTMLMDKVNVDTNKIKRFILGVKQGNVTSAQASQFFFKLERDLKIQSPKLRAARRLIQDWETLSTTQRQLATTQLMQHYRLNGRRSDMMPLFSSFAKDNNLIVSDEKKRTIAGTLAKGAAAFAAGYAVGKAIEL